MKKIFIVIWSVCTLTSCAQKNKTSSKENLILIPVSEKYKDITANNFVDRMLAEVKHYDKEPRYFIRPVQNNCVYEILVNDILMYKDYSLEVLATPIEINSGILRSGEQTVTVRMYPVGDLLKDNYDIDDTVTTLLDNTSMKIEVVKYDAYNVSHRLNDEKTVLTDYSPTKEGTKKFIGSGLPYYEYTFSFNADVPYENEGWLNGEDLTKFDKDELENSVVKFYENLTELYKENDINNLIRLDYSQTLRGLKSYYRCEKYVKEFWEEYDIPEDFENKNYQPVKNYNLEFYGSNKIATLRYPVTNPIDKRLRGKSAFWFKYNKKGGNIMAYWSTIYLYVPLGGTLDDLQTIK